MGVEHKDISVSNLMYDEHTMNGVLIDFDLTTLAGIHINVN